MDKQVFVTTSLWFPSEATEAEINEHLRSLVCMKPYTNYDSFIVEEQIVDWEFSEREKPYESEKTNREEPEQQNEGRLEFPDPPRIEGLY